MARKILLMLVLAFATPAPASASGLDDFFGDAMISGTFGVDFSNGGYGMGQNTNVLLGLTTLSLETGDFKFAASMPYMRINGRGLVVFDASGNAVVINRRATLPATVRTGWGDLNLSATYTIPSYLLDGFEVAVTGTVKAPTAPVSRRLSTGEADWGLNLDISHRYGSWVPFFTVGYLVPGQPATFQIYKTVSVAIGSSYELSEQLVAVGSYNYDSASAPQTVDSHQLVGSLSWLRSDRMTLTGYTKLGLSTGSPDIGGGLLLSYAFKQ